MSFANEFKRAVKEIDQEIAYYRGFAGLDGTQEPLAILVELCDDWQERRRQFEGRGRPPSEPADWDENKTTRTAAKESLDKIIKAAAAAEEAKRGKGQPDEKSVAAAEDQPPGSRKSAARRVLPTHDSSPSSADRNE